MPAGNCNTDVARPGGKVYHRHMPSTHNTPVTLLRPRALTQQDVAKAMGKRGLRVARITVSDFERGKYQPADPFLELYASIVGASRRTVRQAFDATRAAARSAVSPGRRKASRK